MIFDKPYVSAKIQLLLMAAQNESAPKFALVRKTGYEIGRDGRIKSISAEVMGHPDAVRVVQQSLERIVGKENVIDVTESESNTSTWSGFGKGAMDASRAARTKRVYHKGVGWTDISQN